MCFQNSTEHDCRRAEDLSVEARFVLLGHKKNADNKPGGACHPQLQRRMVEVMQLVGKLFYLQFFMLKQ